MARRILLRPTESLDRLTGAYTDAIRAAEMGELRRDLATLLNSSLSKSQRRILSLRYPLDGKLPCTLTEIASLLRWSKERVRAVEWIAMNRLGQRAIRLKRHFD